MSLRTPTGSELRRENCVAMPRRRGGMDVAHVTARRMPAMKPVGKPDAGNPHVRFDERGGETGCFGDTAPLLDSTALSSADQRRRRAGPVRTSIRRKPPFASSLTSNITIARSPLPQANQPRPGRPLNKGVRAPLTIKRQTRSILGFKSFWSAAVTLAGIELMHMIRKGQLPLTGELCPARQFYSLAE